MGSGSPTGEMGKGFNRAMRSLLDIFDVNVGANEI